MNNLLRRSLTVSRNNVLYYELKKMAQRRAEIRRNPEVIRALKKKVEQYALTEPEVVVIKNGEYQKAKMSKLNTDIFEKNENWGTPLVVTYSNDPRFPLK